MLLIHRVPCFIRMLLSKAAKLYKYMVIFALMIIAAIILFTPIIRQQTSED
jgi:hypothetical protein